MKSSRISIRSCAIIFFSLLINSAFIFSSVYYYRRLLSLSLDPLAIDSHIPREHTIAGTSSSPRILFVGDSRASAWPPPSGPLPYLLTNIAVKGHTTSQSLLRFKLISPTLTPHDIVVIQSGINDLKSIPFFPDLTDQIVSNCISNITEIVRLSRLQGSKVVLTTIFPVGDIPLYRSPFWSKNVDRAIDRCNTGLRSLKSEDTYILETQTVLSGNHHHVYKSYQHDFLHINKEGYQALNNALTSLLHHVYNQLPSSLL